MMKPNSYQNEINEVLKKQNYNKADVTYLMTQFRLLIEENKLKDEYQFLNLYCNWTLHSKISGSDTAFEILEFITDSLISHNNDPYNAKDIYSAIIEGLSLHKVLDDIIRIGRVYNIIEIAKFNNFQQWVIFAEKLIEVLEQRPMIFPNPITKPYKKIYQAILRKAKEADDDPVIGIKFVYENDPFQVDENVPPIACWEIITLSTIEKGTRIMGSLMFINQQMVDNYNFKHRK